MAPPPEQEQLQDHVINDPIIDRLGNFARAFCATEAGADDPTGEHDPAHDDPAARRAEDISNKRGRLTSLRLLVREVFPKGLSRKQIIFLRRLRMGTSV